MNSTAVFILTSTLTVAAVLSASIENKKSKIEKSHSDLCCEALAATPFTKNSLYQADTAFTTDTGWANNMLALSRVSLTDWIFATRDGIAPLACN